MYNTATTITSTPNPSYAGGPVTITTHTTVVGTGQPVALGTVQIFGGGTLLTTVPVGSNGEATWTTSDLPAANVALSATFLSSEDPSVAYRASSTDGTLTQVVHACAPTPTFVNQPADAAATTGTTVVLSATVSISPVFEGTPTMQWQTSSDNGATWTAAAGTTAIQTDGLAAGLGRATLSYTASGGPQRLMYRALATTCGGTATSNPAALTVRAIDFDLSTLPTKTFGSPAFDIASYASKSTVPVAFSSSTPATCAVAGTMVTVLAAGTCTITASEDGANGYPAAPQVQQSLASGKKPIAVLASNASQPQGTTSLPTITCTPSGYLGTDNYVTPPLGRVGRITTPADWPVPGFAPFFSPTIGMRAAGTYVSHCSGGDPGPNYVISKYIDGTFTITAPLPPPLKITANNASSTYGTTPPALGATYPSTTGVSGTLSCQAYATSDTSYTAPVALSATTPAGTYTVHCSGLTSSSSTISWVDGTLTVKPASVTVTASSPSDQAQGATYAPTISCSADGFLGTDTFATNPTGAVYDSAGTAPVTIGSNTGVGTYVTKCQGGDPGANYTIAAYVPGTFTIKDVTPPVITVPGDKIVEATGPGGAATTFTATATDAVDGTRPVTCSPASGSTFALGATTVTCTSTDAAGNTGTASFTITVVDTTPPVISVPADRTVEATGPGGAAATFTATAADAVDGTPLVTCTPASGSTFPLGRTTVTCTSTDSAGNTSAAGFTITVVDTTPPVVTVPADKTVEATGPGGAAATFTATAADAVDGTPPATCSPGSGSTFALGRTTVTCTSTDTAGNTGTASFTITVVDTTPPVVTVPADKTVEATGPGGAATTFTATATDAVDGTPPATCTPASGSTFALGRTTVTCTSTDTAGNTGTASFTITVADTTPPKTALGMNLPAPSSNLTNASFSFSGTDAVGPVSFECRLDQVGFAPCTSTKSYTGLSDGSHTFQVRAKDGAGNLDPTPASYTWVVDTTAPVLTVANVTVNATSPAGAAVPFMASATDTNPVSPVVTCSRASGSTFTTGTTTVTCSATDAAGNTGTASFTVTVKGASAQLTDLMTKVQNLPPSLDVTSRKNLLSILQSAQAAVGRGDIQGACDKLTSFASQVSAQTGKKISATAAAGLLADARRIMGVLGCP